MRAHPGALRRVLLLVLGVSVLAGASCPRDRAPSISIRVTTPHLADGSDTSEVTVLLRDARGVPMAGADVLVTLYIGEDVADGVVAEGTLPGAYRASVPSITAGPGVIQAIDTASGATAEAKVFFEPGPAAGLSLRQGRRVETPEARGFVIEALVEDVYLNEIPLPAADVVFTTDAGRLSEVVALDTGLFSTTLTRAGYGTATVTATDRVSGKSAALEVEFPALELTCPARAVHLTGEDGEDTRFELPLTAWIPPGERLAAYRIELTLNELTSFSGAGDGDPEDAFPPPEVEVVSPEVLRLYGTAGRSGGAAGSLELARLSFSCLGEGPSIVEITDAELTAAGPASPRLPGTREAAAREGEVRQARFGGPQGPGVLASALLMQDGRRLPDRPRRGAECTNKTVRRKLCVNPILVKGFDLADGGGNDVTKSEVIRQLQEIQENFDRACCKISLRAGDKKVADLQAADLKEIDDRDFVDGLKDEYSETSTRYFLADDEIKLIRRHADKRLDDCVNLYFVDELPQSRGESIVPGLVTRAGTGKTDRSIRRKTPRDSPVRVDRNGNPAAGGTAVDNKDLHAVIVGEEGMKVRSLKHELGHMLGLLHPADYTGAGLKDATKGSVMEQCTLKGPSYRPKECEIIERNLNGFLKPIR